MYLTLTITGLFFFVSANYELSEGDACISDGILGTCRHIRYCPTVVLVDLKQRVPKHPPICSFVGKFPIVCCTDCDVSDVTNIFVTLDGIQHKLGTNKSYDKCLEYMSRLPYACEVDARVELMKELDESRRCHLLRVTHHQLTGEQAQGGEFPHMALVGYGEDPETLEWSCSGSIISEQFILTAARCSHHPRLGAARQVALGTLRRSAPPAPPARAQRCRVARVLLHPPSVRHDLALMQVDSPINFSPSVLPICLADREVDNAQAQAEVWAAEGYNKPNSDGLRKAWLERLSDEECAALYPEHRHLSTGIDTSTQVCYGDKKDNKDTCQFGDSGGPLQARGGRACVQYLVGVASHGRACGAVYTRVLPYLPWIEAHVWP